MKRICYALLLSLCANLSAININTWSSPPSVVSTPGINASDSHIGMDAAGNIVGIWLEENTLVANTKLLNNGWGSSSVLSSSIASAPQLVVDPMGNANAIWVENGVIKTAALPFGLTWSSSNSLSGTGASAPQIAVDPSGNVVAVWVEGGFIKSATRLFGGSWSTADTLSGSNADSPQISISATGIIVAVWHSVNGVTSINNINAATKQLNGAWSSNTIVSDPSKNSAYPQVVADPNGNAVATWFTYILSGLNYSNVFVQTSTLPSNGSWLTPVTLSEAGARNPADLICKLINGIDDKIMVIWTQSFDETTFYLQSSVSDDKINWSIPADIDHSMYTFSIAATANENGEVFALYMTFDSSSSNTGIYSVESSLDSYTDPYWTGPILISQGANNGFPAITTALVGGSNCYAAATWGSYDGMNTSINSSNGSGFVVSPPSNVTVTQSVNNFGIFQDYFNTISWNASPDLDITGYVVYRNGKQIGFVDSSSTTFIDHNRYQNGAIYYGIAAIDPTNTQSAIINVSFP